MPWDLNIFRQMMTVGAAVGGGASYGEGDILSERWSTETTGWDNAWTRDTPNSDGYFNPTSTAISGTGFVGQHGRIECDASEQEHWSIDLGSDYTTLYFRFYFNLSSCSWAATSTEHFVSFEPDGGAHNNETNAFNVMLHNEAGQFQLYLQYGGNFSSCNISVGTIYKVEGKFIEGGASDTAEFKVTPNGGSTTTFGPYTGAYFSSIRDVWIGLTYNDAASVMNIDTFDISSTGYLTDT